MDNALIDAAIMALKQGQVVGMPTETVYGLAGDARNLKAIKTIFKLKGRPAQHPVIVHIAHVDQLQDWACDIPEHAWQLAKTFWPGPLTLILKRHASVLDEITGGQDSIGIRIPQHLIAQTLLNAFQDGLAAPSANRFGHISPTTAQHVHDEFGTDVPLVLDGGTCIIGIESTIIDARSPLLRILRPGMITPTQIATTLQHPLAENSHTNSPRVSGALAQHYAPHTPTEVIDHTKLSSRIQELRKGNHRFAILTHEAPIIGVPCVVLPHCPISYAHALYASLRKLDAYNVEHILIVMPPQEPEWAAIHDRISRMEHA